MRKQRLSLMDILNPPVNPWLENILKSNGKVPTGVRVVRLSDDDGDDQEYQSPSPRSRLAEVITDQAT